MIPNGDLPEVLTAQIVFWILLPLVLFAPPRWAVVSWLVMGNLDATGPGQSALIAVGWINAVKGVVLPAYLWWRLRDRPGELSHTVPARLWVVLTAYAALATLWAPYTLAAAKLVGNMVGILLTLLALEQAARRGLLDFRSITVLIAASLGLAAVQTYYFGGASYGFDGVDEPTRFSSFIAAQQFAALLVALLAAVLWDRGLSKAARVGLSSLLGAALLLNGSRIWCLGAALVLMAYLWISLRRAVVAISFGAATAVLCVALVANLDLLQADTVEETSSRIVATLSAVLTGQDTAHNAGLRNLGFRLAIYDDVINETRSSTPRELLLGHGTSSGGAVLLRVFPNMFSFERLDPNRAIHNEWLRALYEWGLVGLLLFTSIFGSLMAGLVVRFRDRRLRSGAVAALTFLPSFLGALSTENILAGTGNAVTMGLAIVLSLVWATDPQLYRKPVAALQLRTYAKSHS